jgi:hypothetical protein
MCPFAVAETARQAGDALAVHNTIGNQTHRAPHDIRARIPLRRSRGGLGPATPARPKPGRLRSRGGREEQHVAALGHTSGATGPAIDPGGRHPDVDDAVEALVAAFDRTVATFEVFDHAPIIIADLGSR